VGVYLEPWHPPSSRVGWVIPCSLVEILCNRVVVELLWTLKSRSLGQSEDQAKRSLFGSIRRPSWEVSCLHYILLVDILEGSSSYGYFLYDTISILVILQFCSKFVILFYSRGLIHIGKHLPLRVFINRKLEVHPYHIPTFWQHLPTIRGIIC
jgi:hypothetical protein